MLCGLHQPEAIDLVAHQPATDTVWLMIYHHEESDTTYRHGLDSAQALEAKLGYYRNYVTSGRLASDYPDLAGKPVTIQLESHRPLSAEEDAALQRIEAGRADGDTVGLIVRIVEPQPPISESE